MLKTTYFFCWQKNPIYAFSPTSIASDFRGILRKALKSFTKSIFCCTQVVLLNIQEVLSISTWWLHNWIWTRLFGHIVVEIHETESIFLVCNNWTKLVCLTKNNFSITLSIISQTFLLDMLLSLQCYAILRDIIYIYVIYLPDIISLLLPQFRFFYIFNILNHKP